MEWKAETDLSKIFSGLLELLNIVTAGKLPDWARYGLAIFLLFFAFSILIWILLAVGIKIVKLIKLEYYPLFSNRYNILRAEHRKRFAEHIGHEIRKINSQQQWSDYKFTEMEAEVEAQGRYRRSTLFPFSRIVKQGLKREKSLSRALDRSTDRLILLEGEAGSGKSVSLRHMALLLAKEAARKKNLSHTIPLYFNLRELSRSRINREAGVDRNLIQQFVLQTLNRSNDRDIADFLDREFDRGMKEGTWLFLFDSFDEIPEILSSSEPDEIVRAYADAIADFLHGMNKWRGIIASRQFHGPRGVEWPRFRILPLTDARRQELVQKIELPSIREGQILDWLKASPTTFGSLSGNALFLSLLCEYVQFNAEFPKNTHTVYEFYVQRRLTEDARRISERFGLHVNQVRTIAEKVAYCMTAYDGLGLATTRPDIARALEALGFEEQSDLEQGLNALEYIKLARSDKSDAQTQVQIFAFAHRRFQEYFATCVLLREPERVPVATLLHNARWRESAVVLCQTAPSATLKPLLDEMATFLEQTRPQQSSDLLQPSTQGLGWPKGLFHVLSIIQDGFSGRIEELPAIIRKEVGAWVQIGIRSSRTLNQKLVLEVAGGAEQEVLLSAIRATLVSPSAWLRDTAYQQASYLVSIPDDVRQWLVQSLLLGAYRGTIQKERYSIHAYLSRLHQPESYFRLLYLLVCIPTIDVWLHSCAIGLCLGLLTKANFTASKEHIAPAIIIIIFSIITPAYVRLLYRLISDKEIMSHRFAQILESFIRIFLVFLAFKIGKNADWPLSVLLTLAALLSWRTVAMKQCSTGLSPHPLLWGGLHITMLANIIVGFIAKIHRLMVLLLKYPRGLIIEGLRMVLVAGLIPIIVIAFPVMLGYVWLSIWRDRKHLKLYLERQLPYEDGSNFITDILSLKTPLSRFKLVNFVRERNLLPATLSNLAMLSNFLSPREETLSKKPAATIMAQIQLADEQSRGNILHALWDNLVIYVKILTKLKSLLQQSWHKTRETSPSVLDELFRLQDSIWHALYPGR